MKQELSLKISQKLALTPELRQSIQILQVDEGFLFEPAGVKSGGNDI